MYNNFLFTLLSIYYLLFYGETSGSDICQLTLWRPLLPYGYSYMGTALTLRAERQSARMSKITKVGLTRSGTGCCTHMATVGVKGLKQRLLTSHFRDQRKLPDHPDGEHTRVSISQTSHGRFMVRRSVDRPHSLPRSCRRARPYSRHHAKHHSHRTYAGPV